MSDWPEREARAPSTGWRVSATALCVLVILASVLFLKPWLTDADTYSWYIDRLDEKKVTVLEVTAAATAASTAITLIPDDVGTPVAQQLAQMSGYLLLVLGAIYLEKYLLTIFGLGATWAFLPLSMAMYICHIWWPGRGNRRYVARRMLAFAVMLALLIPVSVLFSSMIEDVYDESIDETITLAKQIESAMDEDDSAEKSLWDKITDATSSIVNGVSSTLGWAKNVLNNFIDAIVVLLVTSCVIPVVVVIVFVKMVKMLVRGSYEYDPRRQLNE